MRARTARAASLIALTFAALVWNRSALAQSVYVESSPSGGGGQFGVLNLLSGAYQNIGTTAVSLTGLALSTGGTLYATDAANVLYIVNPATGQTTARGSLGFAGSQITSIAYASDSQLYGLLSAASGAASLVRINPSGTPSAVSVGSLTFQSDGALAGGASGNLYATEGNLPAFGSGSLYRTTTAGGAAQSLSPGGDAGYDSAPVFALSFAGGALFAIDNGTGGQTGDVGTIYAVTTDTGVATPVSTYSASVVGNVSAATTATVPESATTVLLLPAFVVGAVVARRRLFSLTPLIPLSHRNERGGLGG